MLCKYLTSILASLQISGTHHAFSDLANVGIFTVLVRQNGDFYTLKVKWVEHCGTTSINIHLRTSAYDIKVYFIVTV